MSLGYLGYVKLANTFLLCNSSGLNRQVAPLMSEGVWGAGWYNAAQDTNYADSQQHFEGGINFELQGASSVWNLLRDWLVEQRVDAQSVELSPNGIDKYNYTKDAQDPRTGVWLSQAGFSIGNNELVKISATGIALRRTESVAGANYKAIRVGPGLPVNPLNPSPKNRNPIPGWNCKATIVIPNFPAAWTTSNLTGSVLQSAEVNVNNNTQIIRGCTGDNNPVAVLQGTMAVEGSITVWRDGSIPDPYGTGSFQASGASMLLQMGGAPSLDFNIRYVLITSDAFDIQGKNNPTVRVFGFAGLGDGVYPPLTLTQA
jgi:hypothetical protein